MRVAGALPFGRCNRACACLHALDRGAQLDATHRRGWRHTVSHHPCAAVSKGRRLTREICWRLSATHSFLLTVQNAQLLSRNIWRETHWDSDIGQASCKWYAHAVNRDP